MGCHYSGAYQVDSSSSSFNSFDAMSSPQDNNSADNLNDIFGQHDLDSGVQQELEELFATQQLQDLTPNDLSQQQQQQSNEDPSPVMPDVVPLVRRRRRRLLPRAPSRPRSPIPNSGAASEVSIQEGTVNLAQEPSANNSLDQGRASEAGPSGRSLTPFPQDDIDNFALSRSQTRDVKFEKSKRLLEAHSSKGGGSQCGSASQPNPQQQGGLSVSAAKEFQITESLSSSGGVPAPAGTMVPPYVRHATFMAAAQANYQRALLARHSQQSASMLGLSPFPFPSDQVMFICSRCFQYRDIAGSFHGPPCDHRTCRECVRAIQTNQHVHHCPLCQFFINWFSGAFGERLI